MRQFAAPANRSIGKALPAPSNRWFAFGKTGGAFVATSGSLEFCSSPSIMRSNSRRSGKYRCDDGFISVRTDDPKKSRLNGRLFQSYGVDTRLQPIPVLGL